MVSKRYKTLVLKHKGSLFSIYKAHDVWEGKTVALKMLNAYNGEEDILNFQSHYKTMAKCSHFLLAPVKDYSVWPVTEKPFYTMPWLDYPTIERKHFRPDEIVTITIQVCQALVYLHRLGHTSIKLKRSHVFWLPETGHPKSRVKLINYGLPPGKHLDNSSNQSLKGHEYQKDALQLVFVIRSLISDSEGFDSKFNDFDKTDLKKLDQIFEYFLQKEISIDKDAVFLMALHIINTFYNHAYTKNPIRQVYFTEGFFVERSDEQTKLSEWYTNKSDPCLLLAGFPGSGRRRLLRNWLPEINVQECSVLEINVKQLGYLKKWISGNVTDHIPDEISAFLHSVSESLLIVTSDKIIQQNFHSLLSIINKLAERNMRVIFRVNENDLDRFQTIKQVSVIWFSAWSASEISLMVKSLHGDALPRWFFNEVYKYSVGNPGLAIKILNHWIAEYLLVCETGSWHLISDEQVTMPVSDEIKQFYNDRINHLNGITHDLLKLFSFFRKPFNTRLLNKRFPEQQVSSAINLLKERNYLVLFNGDPEMYTVAQVYKSLIREQTTDQQTQEIHRMLAKITADIEWSLEETAYHWLQAEEYKKGIQIGLEAAWEMINTGAYQDAEIWINELLQKSHTIPDVLKGKLMYAASEAALLRNRHRDSVKYAETALKLLPQTLKFLGIRTFMYQCIGQILMRETKFSEAEAFVQRGLQEIEHHNLETSVTLRILSAAIARHQGKYDQARAAVAIAFSNLKNISEPKEYNSAYATILNIETALLIDAGDFDKSRALIDKAIVISDKNSFGFYRTLFRNKRAELEASLGLFNDAERYLIESMRLLQETSIQSEYAAARQINGTIALYRGQYEDADSFYRHAIDTSLRLNRTLDVIQQKRMLAGLYRVRGNFDQADELLKSISDVLHGPAYISICVETGMLFMERACYTSAYRYFVQALNAIQKTHCFREEEHVFYALAMISFRLNQISRTKQFMNKACQKAVKKGNVLLMARLQLLQARLARLDRNRRLFYDSIRNAEKLFQKCESKEGIMFVQEFLLRDVIDINISDSVWAKAIELWESARVFGSWHLMMDTAMTIGRLGLRRGNVHHVLEIVDLALEKARKMGCREYVWRFLRLRSQLFDHLNLVSASHESLLAADKNIDDIVQSLRSPAFVKSYKRRLDVQYVKKQLNIRKKDEKTPFSGTVQLPSLKKTSDVTGDERIAFSDEHYRLLRSTVRQFRKSVDRTELIDAVLNAVLRLTGADRALVFLKLSEQDVYEMAGSRRVGAVPELNSHLLRSSSIFQSVVLGKTHVFGTESLTKDSIKNVKMKRLLKDRSGLFVPMRSARDVVGVIYADVREDSSDTLIKNVSLVQELADEAGLSLELSSLYNDIDKTFMSMVRALGAAVDAKDPHTHGHSSRVARYALTIGREMGLDLSDLRDLEISAYLHDLGKIGISGDILKSVKKLSVSEHHEIQQHPVIATRILKPVLKFARVAKAIRQHHERFDGKGYPDHLQANEIHPLARIIAISDALDAMTTYRPYQQPMSLEEAIGVILKNAGTQFDPEITAILEKLYKSGHFQLA